ncbi:winged helix-turn-helix transcriptional regulator [Niabella sp. 22666]|jgi:DNA-binding HxlR family transcriptional regulator|uniref:winged helix-turn-helix transcriptional regulator n=1 Tax=Niabella sp. 22666 TaxID=3453954 RepID=UPI003F85908A
MGQIKVSSTNFENKKIMNDACPEVYAASILGTQWTLAICSYLVLGKHRFSELRKKIPGITERMLTLKLRELEQQKIVKRTVYAEVPLRVEYELTKIGKDLEPLIRQLETWGKKHKKLMGG